MNARLEDEILTELDKQTNAGLTSTNMDRIYKLLCMLKELHMTNYYESETNKDMEYAPRNIGFDTGSKGRYMNTKKAYRNDRSGDMKRNLINKLETYMDEVTNQIEDMYNDAECAEERQTIQRYINQMRFM